MLLGNLNTSSSMLVWGTLLVKIVLNYLNLFLDWSSEGGGGGCLICHVI